MTIRQLIEKLKDYDQSLLVTVDGYEGGYTDDLNIRKIELKLNYHDTKDTWWYGAHEEWDEDDDQDITPTPSLNIGR